MTADVVAALRSWSDWRLYSAREEVGWPGATVTGRLLDGMPSTVCPICRGKGYVTERDLPSIRGRIECPNQDCTDGRIQADPRKGRANPAYIRSTGSSNDDPLMYTIDAAVCELRREARGPFTVLWHEYTRNGTQEHKAHRLCLPIAHYLARLEEAHVFVSEAIRAHEKNSPVRVDRCA